MYIRKTKFLKDDLGDYDDANHLNTNSKELELAVFYIEIRFLKANERGYQANADNPF